MQMTKSLPRMQLPREETDLASIHDSLEGAPVLHVGTVESCIISDGR